MHMLPMTRLNRRKLLISAKLAGMSASERRNRAEDTNNILELLIISKDRSPYVRAGLVMNDRTPSSVLKLMAHEASPGIRFAVLQHHNVPKNCAKLLMHDKNPKVKGLAEFLLKMREIHANNLPQKKQHERDGESEDRKEVGAEMTDPHGKSGGT